MAEKTIPELTEVTTITENALFVVDTGVQTFKMQAENVALFMRDAILPPGLTSPYAGSAAPAGWLLCDGSAIDRDDFLALFVAIGTTYGVGDASTTFNLPDLRGRVVAGKDNMGGSAANRITNAIAGFIGINLGAAGGDQATTPAGTIGGTQAISHTHSIGHTHTHSHSHLFYHTHVVMRTVNAAADRLRGFISSDPSTTFSLNTGPSDDAVTGALMSEVTHATGGLSSATFYGGDRWWYTSGVVDAPDGDALTAETTDADSTTTSGTSVTNSGGMTVNSIVNGSNFSFTGTAGHRVQPTMIMNYIIKT